MFRENNQNLQFDFLDPFQQMGEKMRQELEASWAGTFYREIFCRIDETPFAVLYSDQPSRPNSAINVLVGSEILKAGFGWSDEELWDQLRFNLQARFALALRYMSVMPVELRRVEFVGPQVGEELAEDGGLAMLYAILGILVYITVRFQLRFALGAIAALVHDVLITIGIFSIFNMEFTLPIIAAILTIIGYSLNDTIVVYDRIRENVAKMRDRKFPLVVNASINETLSRTLLTSLTTLFTCVSIWIVGTGVPLRASAGFHTKRWMATVTRKAGTIHQRMSKRRVSWRSPCAPSSAVAKPCLVSGSRSAAIRAARAAS